MVLSPPSRRILLHGLSVQVSCQIPAMEAEVERLAASFPSDNTSPPPSFIPAAGLILSYAQSEVARCLSPRATRVADLPPHLAPLELYEEAERFWLLDDRWGLCEMNLLRGQWRSWLLPHPAVEPAECLESAVLWPLAQVLRSKGLHVLPAASVARGSWAALLLAPFGIEPELNCLIHAGYRVIGQRWTAARVEADGQVSLLHMPGRVQRLAAPWPPRGARVAGCHWVDLTSEYLGSHQPQAICQQVFAIEPGRRPRAMLHELAGADAASELRRSWPIPELHPVRRGGALCAQLARQCRCAAVQLSRNPHDLLKLLEASRLAATPPVSVTVHIPSLPIGNHRTVSVQG